MEPDVFDLVPISDCLFAMAGHLFDLDKIVAVMAEAALDSDQWQPAMDRIAELTGSFGAVLLPPDTKQRSFPSSQSLQRTSEAYIEDRWNERDERYRGVSVLMRNGIFTDFDILSPDTIKRSPFYQEFLGRFRLAGFAGIKIGTGDNVWALSIQRKIEQAHYQPDELDALRRLNHMTQSVFATAQALGFARGESSLATFDVMDKAAVLLDRKGEIIRANNVAQEVLKEELRSSNRKLRLSDSEANAKLNTILHKLIWLQKAVAAPPILIPRPDGSALIAYAMRNPVITDAPFSPFAAIVVFADLEARIRPALATLKISFGLTPAEARLAIAIASGRDVTGEAQRTGLSRETLKTQLRSVFAKTSTKRQAELVALTSQFLPKL